MADVGALRASAPSIGISRLPQAWGALGAHFAAVHNKLEAFLERQRDSLPIWAVIGFGVGIGLWFWLPAPLQWSAMLCLAAGAALGGFALVPGRSGRALG